MKKKSATICILVATTPQNASNTHTLFKITESALTQGHKVEIFLISDGIYHILQENFVSLIDKGAEVTLCAHNALERNLEKRPGITFGSQYDFSVMVSRSDTFLSLH